MHGIAGHTAGPRAETGRLSRSNRAADLVVLSHLRWTWVWQRPQQLVSRFAAMRSRVGARTWFVEEPETADVFAPALRWEELESVTRIWLALPPTSDGLRPTFGSSGSEAYGDLVGGLLRSQGRPPAPDVLIYTPLAYETAQRLRPGRVGYDVMDDLASFANAPEGLRLAHR